MGSAEVNGKLWGAQAKAWSELQERVHRPPHEHVFSTTGVKAGTAYFDLGCGSGMAIQLAVALGEGLVGADAAADLFAIARQRERPARICGKARWKSCRSQNTKLRCGRPASIHFQYAAAPAKACSASAKARA